MHLSHQVGLPVAPFTSDIVRGYIQGQKFRAVCSLEEEMFPASNKCPTTNESRNSSQKPKHLVGE